MPRRLVKLAARPPLILVADDDPLFRESLSANLLDSGYDITGFPDGEELLQYMDSGGDGDLILLDWKMPKVNGIEVLRRLRSSGHATPVIFLTVLSDQFYEEAALHGGAVDFVEKSRSFSILAKRIELTLQGPRQQNAEGAPLPPSMVEDMDIGPLHLNVATGRAQWGNAEVPLSFTEFRLVHSLASRAGQDIGYRELYDMVHGEGFYAGPGADGYRSNVRTFIKRIRQKFRDIDPRFEEIENYPGFGYRWRRDG
ncbi:MAG: response regulator transcription factor [Rhodospirillaceae bacterium]